MSVVARSPPFEGYDQRQITDALLATLARLEAASRLLYVVAGDALTTAVPTVIS